MVPDNPGEIRALVDAALAKVGARVSRDAATVAKTRVLNDDSRQRGVEALNDTAQRVRTVRNTLKASDRTDRSVP